MKLLKLSFLLVLALAFTACDDDEDGTKTCTQSDWLGVYSGTIVCNGDSEDVTVTIIADGDNDVIIKYETSSLEAEFDPITPNGCDLSRSGSGNGLTVTVEASIDGDMFTMKETLSDGTDTGVCDVTATRN